MRTTTYCGLGALFMLGGAACGSQDTTCVDGASDGSTCGAEASELAFDGPAVLESLDSDLDIGSRGPEVRAVHDYLTSYGYLPNDTLQHDFPAWRPLVDEAPADPLTYDATTRRAVSELQVFSGLADTGVVDQPTRELLRMRRCGVPDGIAPTDASNKYALIGSQWGKSNLTWQVNVSGANITGGAAGSTVLQMFTAAATQAFAKWSNQSLPLQITNQTSGTADIMITFSPLGGFLGLTQPPGPGIGGDLQVDSATAWSVASTTPATRYDLETLLIHEIGHALGLSHSSLTARMKQGQQGPGFQQRQTFTDDNVGISVLFDQFNQVTGSARDIAVGGDGNAWIITNTASATAGEFTIQKRSGSSFVTTNNGSGVRIAVGAFNRPWVTGADGTVWRRTSNTTASGSWEGPLLTTSGAPACATDIGGNSANGGTVWIIGCTPLGGGFPISKWNETSQRFVQANNGEAVRIAVDENGVPWVVDSNHFIHFRSLNGAPSNSPSAPSSWTQTQEGLAVDIGIGPANYPWVLGAGPEPGGFEIYAWDSQPFLAGGQPPAPETHTWYQVAGGGVAIAVDSSAKPWVVNNAGQVFRPLL